MRSAMRRLIAISLLLLVVGCYNHTDTPSLGTILPQANTTIEQLRTNISPLETTLLEQEIIVVGRVTSSDSDGNFHKSMTIEDDSGGLELRVNQYDLGGLYPEGLKVALRLRGCAAHYSFGMLQIGSKAESYNSYEVNYLSSMQRIDEVVVRSNDVCPITAPQRHIVELRPNDCGRLVRIDSLNIIASTSIDTLEGETLDIARWRGYSMFCDPRGDTLVVYTSEYANYAEDKIPHGSLSITGIVQHGSYQNMGEYYQLKMRYAKDCSTTY